MKIGYFSDGPWSHNALIKILSNKTFKLKFIVPRFNKPDPVLKELSKEYKIDYLIIKNVNSENSVSVLESYNCDIFISMSFDQIIKKKLINMTPYGFINCHAGALPYYRGRSILNWVLINDEKSFGITVVFIQIET